MAVKRARSGGLDSVGIIPAMDFPALNEGLWTFVHTGPGASGEVVCTLGFSCLLASDYDQSTNDIVAQSWEDNVVTNCLDSSMTFIRLDTLIGVGFGNVNFWTTSSGASGGLTGNDILPLNNAVLVKKNTGKAGRRNQGRLYLPGVPEDAVDDAGNVLSSFMTTIDTAFSDLTTDVIGGTPSCVPAILHRAIDVPSKPAYTLDPEDATGIVAFQTQSKIATQRTRIRD